MDCLARVLGSSEPDQLRCEVSTVLSKLSGICHGSLWGLDSNERRVFFAFEFIDHLSIRGFPTLTVRNFGEGLIGKVADSHRDQICRTKDVPKEQLSPETLDTISRYQIETIAIFSPDSPQHYPSIVALASTNSDTEDLESNLANLKHLFGAFLNSFSRIKSRLFEDQLHRIIRAKASSQGLDFLKTSCGPIASAFGASTFSVWKIDNGTVKPEFFSQPHPAKEYKMGEGLTGYVAQSGQAVFLHRVSDAKEIYGIDWLGKSSDFGDGRHPNRGDHMIIIPLIYPTSTNTKPSPRGLIRFVAPYDGPSFWPIDFERAKDVATALSNLLYHEELFSIEKRNNMILTNLLETVSKTSSSEPIDETLLTFVCEVQKWPGVTRAFLFDQQAKETNGSTEIESTTLLPNCVKETLLSTNWARILKGFCLNDRTWVAPIRRDDDLYAIFLVELGPSFSKQCFDWLQLASAIMGYFCSNNKLLEITAQLRRVNEDQQMWSLAGAMARTYAHEALNGLKAIQSWISNSRAASTPNYSVLEQRAEQIFRNVNDLLDSTGFEKLYRRKCIFNAELDKYISQLGYRHLKKFGKCEIRLSIANAKHRTVDFDPTSLTWVLNNLIVNAKEQYDLLRKAGPIEITLIEREVQNVAYVGFSVLDYAVGISPEALPHIFTSGFTTKPNGRGLGLPIVKRLVQEFDGLMEVDTKFGVYTKFIILYPTIL